MVDRLALPGYEDAVLIGRGGLGRVFRARRLSTGGDVAIKELFEVPQGSSSQHRARRELEAMLRVKGHSHIVSVEEILDGPNGPCIVMEFLPEGSIADRIIEGPLPLPEAVLVGQQTLSALAAAHAVGIVHRDIKPQNIMVSGFGQVKVCDFGISSFAWGDTRTQTSSLTLAYASPEELDGDEVGPPADVFSFCVTMQHVLTGERPKFQSRGRNDTWSIPDGAEFGRLHDVLVRGQEHEPEARPSVDVLLDELDHAAQLLGPRAVRSLAPTADVLDAPAIVRRWAEPAPEVAAEVQPEAPADFEQSPPERVVPGIGVVQPSPDGDHPQESSNDSGDAADTVIRPRSTGVAGDQADADPAKRHRRRNTALLCLAAVLAVVGAIVVGVLAWPDDTDDASSPLVVGAEVYDACASCHGGSGEGGVGYAFAEGEVLATFPNIEDQLRWVYFGTAEYNLAGVSVYGDPDREGGAHVSGGRGVMPAHGESVGGRLRDDEILAVVCHERYELSGADQAGEYADEFQQWCSGDSDLYQALVEGAASLATLHEVDSSIIPIGDAPSPGSPAESFDRTEAAQRATADTFTSLVDADWNVDVLAGSGARGLSDGFGAAAEFVDISDAVVDEFGSLFVLDDYYVDDATGQLNGDADGGLSETALRRIGPDGEVETLFQSQNWKSEGQDPAELSQPSAVALDPDGNVWVLDGDGSLHEVPADGHIGSGFYVEAFTTYEDLDGTVFSQYQWHLGFGPDSWVNVGGEFRVWSFIQNSDLATVSDSATILVDNVPYDDLLLEAFATDATGGTSYYYNLRPGESDGALVIAPWSGNRVEIERSRLFSDDDEDIATIQVIDERTLLLTTWRSGGTHAYVYDVETDTVGELRIGGYLPMGRVGGQIYAVARADGPAELYLMDREDRLVYRASQVS